MEGEPKKMMLGLCNYDIPISPLEDDGEHFENSLSDIRGTDFDSSESEGETEPAKSFHRRISTNRDIKCAVSVKEGYLTKQTTSFQRWRRRYFKIKGRKLYYAKDTKSNTYDEIDLQDLSVAECSTKNINHSFQCITPFRVLVLGAETRRDMEEWISALKSAVTNQYYEGMDQMNAILSGQHNWYATSHARPTYCNICREALSGVTSHGLSCEVCKMKSHKRCAAKAVNNCKWTTLSSVGKDIIEEDDGSLAMPHQWLEGNLPVSGKCAVCEKTCGSVRRLQDWRCLWCKSMVHTACRPLHHVKCPLGPSRVSVIPPTALTTIGTDETWEATRPQGCSPLLVFVNSKSGENQGVRFLRRFKQLLNPAQVFDLLNGGPIVGLRLFKCFSPFRILVCSGDGSVGWVLSEIDNLNMTNQCQIGVLPLGTGNDLARVLGWGSFCDDDAHLPQLIEKYERATTKMLDRWSVMTYVSHVPIETESTEKTDDSTEPFLTQVTRYEDSVASHLLTLLQSDQHSQVLSSARVICETVKSLIMKIASRAEPLLKKGESDSLTLRCETLNVKLDLLLKALNQESSSLETSSSASGSTEGVHEEKLVVASEIQTPLKRTTLKKTKAGAFVEREKVISRANSLKKAVRQIIEIAEKALDEQNQQTGGPIVPPRITLQCVEDEPGAQISPPRSPTDSSNFLSPNYLSPMPDVRRESEDFEYLPTLPVPSEFADLERERSRRNSALSGSSRRNSALSGSSESRRESSSLCYSLLQDIEVRIQSSNENLVDVGDDEPYTFEEKSISEIRDFLASSQDTSIDDDDDDDDDDFDDFDDEFGSSPPVTERGAPDGIGREDEVKLKEDKDPKEDKDSGDSEDTDDTIREKMKKEVKSLITIEVQEPEGVQLEVPEVHLEPAADANRDGAEDIQKEDTLPCILIEDPEGDTQASITLPTERIVEGAESNSDDEMGTKIGGLALPTSWATRRVSTGAALKLSGSPISLGVSGGLTSAGRDKIRSPERSGRSLGGSASRGSRRNLPIINPIVTLPMWPSIAAGGSPGLISKVLLANADALCAAASPLMDIDDSSLDGFSERCIMNNYFGIGIDAKITLDFHNKREEHPEKCRSRTRNFMWYGVLASKEWLCKTYKNLEQRVYLECDGERIPLPSLQGIVILNIPSFMGGTNFWGGKKEDDCFIAPSFDDRILEVVAVFGSAQMAASRIINLQHHRIAQCSSVKITILGEESLPVQVDGEAWAQPPCVMRIVHKNRVQMLCRNRELEISLKTWEEKLQIVGKQSKHLSLLTDEEIQCLASLANAVSELQKQSRLLAATSPVHMQQLTEMTGSVQSYLDKIWREHKVIEGPNLRMLATELVNCIKGVCSDLNMLLKEGNLVMTSSQEDHLRMSLLQVDSELKKAHEKDHLVHFEEEAVPPPQERKRSLSKGALFKLKLRREATRGRGGLEGQVREWTVEEVGGWLEKLGLWEHKEAFIVNDIRGAELLFLERRDLKELGVTKIGHIKRIQQAVKDIKENKPPPPPT